MKRLALGVLAWLALAAPLFAQNPVSISRIGTTPVSATLPVTQSGNWLVQGLVAHDAPYSGNPLPLGCYASASAPSDVSGDGDIARMWCLRNGALSVSFTNTTIAVTQATATSLKAQAEAYQGGTAVGSGNPLQVTVANTGANATAIKVDGSAVTQPVSGVVGLSTGTNKIGYVNVKPIYGTKTAMTWTGTSLGNGSSRESTVVDMTSTTCKDVRIRFQSKGQASATNYLNWYVYTALGDTTYTDGATGSDAAFTTANRFNSRFLCAQKMNANTAATQIECQMSDAFSTVPDKWGVIGDNEAGAALSATAGDHVLEYMCVN